MLGPVGDSRLTTLDSSVPSSTHGPRRARCVGDRTTTHVRRLDAIRAMSADAAGRRVTYADRGLGAALQHDSWDRAWCASTAAPSREARCCATARATDGRNATHCASARPSATPRGRSVRTAAISPSARLRLKAGGAIGVDVETMQPTEGAPRSRRALLRELPPKRDWARPPTRTAHFRQLWVLEEAYLKALGVGLAGGSTRSTAASRRRRSSRASPAGGRARLVVTRRVTAATSASRVRSDHAFALKLLEVGACGAQGLDPSR